MYEAVWSYVSHANAKGLASNGNTKITALFES